MKMEENYEGVPGTWAHTLKEHWDIFTEHTWRAFSVFEEETRKIAHENKIDKFKWREYLLWDMRKRHEEEKMGWISNDDLHKLLRENEDKIISDMLSLSASNITEPNKSLLSKIKELKKMMKVGTAPFREIAVLLVDVIEEFVEEHEKKKEKEPKKKNVR